MSGGFLSWLAGYRPERATALAHESRTAERNDLLGAVHGDERRFVEAMVGRERSPHVVLGTAAGTDYRLPLADMAGLFTHITATTGGGKSRFVGAWMNAVVDHLISGTLPISLILADLKGETADLFLRALGGRLQTASKEQRAKVLERLITIRFFSGETLPEFNLLAPADGADPLTQAYALAETIESTVGAALGSRQVTAFGTLLALAIEQRLTLIELRYLVHDPERVAALAARSKLAEVRHYIATRFARERGVADGIVSRLDALLRIQSVKAASAGPGILDVKRCFIPGAISVWDFGGSPLGSDEVRRAMSALAIARLTSAVFDPTRDRRGFTVIVCDELAEAITPATLANVSRLLVTARSFGVGVISLHQSVAQLPKEVQTLLATNCRMRVIGRSSEADARDALEWLPKTGRVPRPRIPGRRSETLEFLSDAEERNYRVAEVGHLPRQHFVIADRAAPFGSRVIRAPDFDPPAWDRLDPALADALLKGSVGVPRTELLRRAAELEARVVPPNAPGPTEASAVATTEPLPPPVPSPRQSTRRRRAPAPGPDVITPAVRPLKGDVP
jgi:hypothetical protein